MVLMALDHTRDFFAASGMNPRDVADPALFLTRWVTHFCAPTFIFLAGMSAYLYGTRGRSAGEVSRFLLTRGFWLIVIEFTLVRLGWSFSPHVHFFVAQVIWVIGASMVVLAGLVHLPRWAIAAFGLVMIAGHNLLDGIRAEDSALPAGCGISCISPRCSRGQHAERCVPSIRSIPWAGVMAAGYALGPVMQLDAAVAPAPADAARHRRHRRASSCCAPATSTATPPPGHGRAPGWQRCCRSSTARSIRPRCSTWR